MSDYRTAIYARFINRRKGLSAAPMPVLNRISLSKDLRQLCDSFDFDISYRLTDTIDLHSHDFVEFFTIIDGEKFQLSCGYVEDFVKDTTSGTHRFQANGRDFLGQLMSLPFFKAKAIETTTLLNFAKLIVDQNYIVLEGQNDHTTYLSEYLGLKRVANKVIDLGAYALPINVPELSDSKVAPVLQTAAEEFFNLVYQNRFGQLVIWGRDHLYDLDTGATLSETGDDNVNSMTLRENFSKVFSEVKVVYTGGTGAIAYSQLPSQTVVNTEDSARQIFQPEIRTFQTSSLVTAAGNTDLPAKANQLAASIMRKSNQSLKQIVVKTSRPFYVSKTGVKKAYEQHQLFTINAPSYNLHRKMRLTGINYQQDAGSLNIELLFLLPDTLA